MRNKDLYSAGGMTPTIRPTLYYYELIPSTAARRRNERVFIYLVWPLSPKQNTVEDQFTMTTLTIDSKASPVVFRQVQSLGFLPQDFCLFTHFSSAHWVLSFSPRHGVLSFSEQHPRRLPIQAQSMASQQGTTRNHVQIDGAEWNHYNRLDSYWRHRLAGSWLKVLGLANSPYRSMPLPALIFSYTYMLSPTTGPMTQEICPIAHRDKHYSTFEVLQNAGFHCKAANKAVQWEQ